MEGQRRSQSIGIVAEHVSHASPNQIVDHGCAGNVSTFLQQSVQVRSASHACTPHAVEQISAPSQIGRLHSHDAYCGRDQASENCPEIDMHCRSRQPPVSGQKGLAPLIMTENFQLTSTFRCPFHDEVSAPVLYCEAGKPCC